MSSQTYQNTSSFLSIQNISINFNSQSGLLASATQQDLYNISVRNGCAQSYYEWQGYNNNVVNGEPNPTSQNPYNPLAPVPTGSLLVLNPALDFSLPEMLSCGSLGQFSLQFNITVKNNFNQTFAPEICLITKNDGLFVTQQGTSIIYSGILDKATVLKTKEETVSLDFNTHQRLVGGTLGNRGFGALKKMLKYHGAKHMIEGGATSGGATSGGAMGAGISGGAHHHRRHKLSKHLL